MLALFGILFITAMVISSIGFKKYVWFISLGYGFSIAAIGVVLLIRYRTVLTVSTAVICLLFVLYGCRLGGYLAARELKSKTYNAVMKKEIGKGESVTVPVKTAIWVSASLLYACQTFPVGVRLEEGRGGDVALVIGVLIMCCGLILESSADLQKSAAKKKNPHRFVDTGLFRIVRCPNYFGEMLFWTGVFVSGFSVLKGAGEWIAAILGYAGIIYVMFGGARRLEIRQDKNYGKDPEYQAYVKKTPIMIPFIPLYSVKKHKWLVA